MKATPRLRLTRPEPKYRNKKCEWQGEKFDSKAEMARYLELLALQRGGHISSLTRQASFVLVPAVKLGGRTKPAMKYKADFCYTENGECIIEDVKGGALTALFRAKQHLMKHVHGIEIRIYRK